VGAFAADFFGATLSARHYGHYYMQVVPAFVLVAACGGAFLLSRLKEIKKLAWNWLLPVALAILAWDCGYFLYYAARLGMPTKYIVASSLGKYIREHSSANDTLWVIQGNHSRLYLESGRLSPTKYLYAADHLFINMARSTAEEKLATLRSELQHAPPKFILFCSPRYALSCGRFLESSGLDEWIRAHYDPLDVPAGEQTLMVRREKAIQETSE
jgi:hypothetical protein